MNAMKNNKSELMLMRRATASA